MDEKIVNETKYYIKKGRKRLGGFSLYELGQQPISSNTLIWFHGLQDWRKLKDIPELTETYKAVLIRNPKRRTTALDIAIVVCIVAVGVIGFLLYKNKSSELKPLSTEQLYDKCAKSVVLIKHSFLYKIHIGSLDFYFKNYNPETGEVRSFTSNYDSAKMNLNTIWGTGFFIDSAGRLLTCRHVVDVLPPKEDQIKILDFLKKNAMFKLNALYIRQQQLNEDIESLTSLLMNYANSMNSFDYAQKVALRDDKINELKEVGLSVSEMEIISRAIFQEDNFISKNSIQFGIFINDTFSTTLDDYIKCRSENISGDENVDLAVIQTIDAKLPNNNILPLNLSRIKNIEKEPLKLSETVRMIGYNYGIDIANTSGGIKSQITEGAISQNSDANRLLYTIPALPGSSGSPIFDQFGRVISVNFAGVRNSQSFNYGIQPHKIEVFLSK